MLKVSDFSLVLDIQQFVVLLYGLLFEHHHPYHIAFGALVVGDGFLRQLARYVEVGGAASVLHGVDG